MKENVSGCFLTQCMFTATTEPCGRPF